MEASRADEVFGTHRIDAEPRGPNIPSIRVIMKDGRLYKNTLTDWRPEYLHKPDLSKLRTSETY